jgi:hypothetical protein
MVCLSLLLLVLLLLLLLLVLLLLLLLLLLPIIVAVVAIVVAIVAMVVATVAILASPWPPPSLSPRRRLAAGGRQEVEGLREGLAGGLRATAAAEVRDKLR